MKKLWKHFGIVILTIIIGLFFAACGNPAGGGNGGDAPSTKGRLTITGLEDYNGYYIAAFGGVYDEEEEEDGLYLFAGGGMDFSEMILTGTRISNGKAVLNVWEEVLEASENEMMAPTTTGLKPYSGNDQNIRFHNVFIISGSTPSFDNDVAYGELLSVNFNNGIATAAISNIIPVVRINLGNGITGRLEAYSDGNRSDIRLWCNIPYEWRTENGLDSIQDFEVIVNGQTITFDNAHVARSNVYFIVDEVLFTVGEASEIQIKYTANPSRPIKVWNTEDSYVPPANAATLGSFDTGVRTVIVEGR